MNQYSKFVHLIGLFDMEVSISHLLLTSLTLRVYLESLEYY